MSDDDEETFDDEICEDDEIYEDDADDEVTEERRKEIEEAADQLLKEIFGLEPPNKKGANTDMANGKKKNNEEEEVVHVAEIVRHGDKLVLPERLEPHDAITVLRNYIEHQEKITQFSETLDCFIWDGAIALWKAANELFGFATPVPTPGFWKDDPPALMSIRTGLNTTTMVPWGSFTLPGIEGRLETSVFKDQQTQRFMFRATALVKRKHEKQLRELFRIMREMAAENSIYRGKPVKMRFYDEDDDPIPMPEPRFLDLRNTMESQLVLNRDTKAVVDTALFTPLEHPQRCQEVGIPLKRGIMLAGPFGTGKTLLAYVAAKKAVENGWTFCYCERANELAQMVAFAHQYQPALIFCEDIDRVMSGDRSMDMDTILNIIDGIESKSAQIMVVLTTNEVVKINRAMLRPGRLDAVIEVGYPDAKAVEELIYIYGGQWLVKGESLEKVAQELKGQSPAVVRECVERSKLSAIKLSPDGELRITAEALYDAAIGMRYQLNLLQDKKTVEPSIHERLGNAFHEVVVAAKE